jgi:hypothetical protein
MSNKRSASSKIIDFTNDKLIFLWFTKSQTLPGVPMRICTSVDKISFCLLILSPPMILTHLIPRPAPNFSNAL